MKTRSKIESSVVLVTLLFAFSLPGCGRTNDDELASSTWKSLEAAASADPNLFASGLAGIAVTKPPEWRFVPNEEISNVRGNVELGRKDLEEMMRSAQLPVVSIMKYPDTHLGANPTVQIGVRSKKYYPKTDPVDLLTQIVTSMKSTQTLPDLIVLEDVRSTQIDSIPAATVTLRFTLRLKSGQQLTVLSTLYYVTNSENVIIIGISGPLSGRDKSDEEFTAILQSVRLAR
jgi:hypothetical protein